MSDISAMIVENCFENLNAQEKRVGSLGKVISFMKSLEDHFLCKERFEKELQELLKY